MDRIEPFQVWIGLWTLVTFLFSFSHRSFAAALFEVALSYDRFVLVLSGVSALPV